MSLNTQETVEKYYAGWNNGNIGDMEEVLSEDFNFQGPMEQHNTRADFIASCKKMADNPLFQNIKVKPRTQLVQGDEACYLYDFESGSPAKSTPMAEYFKVRNGKIEQIRLYFDGRAFA